MTRRASPRLTAYTALAALGLVAGLAAGRPELVVLVSPLAAFVAAALVLSREPRVRVGFALSSERAIEGAELRGRLTVTSERPVERLDLALTVPRELVVDPPQVPAAFRLRAGEPRTVELAVGCPRWGGFLPGDVALRAHDRLDLVLYEARLDCRLPLRVYPTPERLRLLVRPLETQATSGNELARSKGDGIEFADTRRFAFGDPVRRVNWRASAKRRDLYVSERHPELNSDVILFLDSFTDVRERGRGTLDLAVRAAASLAAAYLAERDRVGVVGFGTDVDWLTPAMGERHLYRILDTLIESRVVESRLWRNVNRLPARMLPAKALIVALTPLADDRIVGALLDLRGRGYDLSVVEVSPLAFVPRDPGREPAYRLWLLARDALHFRFERLGVPLTVWDGDGALASSVEEVRRFRRFARSVRA